jgi:hypothetical protein
MKNFLLLIAFSIAIQAYGTFPMKSVPNSIEPTPKTKLLYHKGITRSEVETYLGRELNGGERLAFFLHKRRFIDQFVNAPEEEKGTDGFAIAGFVTSLFFPVVGVVLSAIGLGRVKKNGKKGKGLATAGLIIGIITTALFLLL